MGVLLLALIVGGVGWTRGWFSPAASAPKLKPAAGQTFPDRFGDRNTRVLTGVEGSTSAFYKDSSGRTYTIAINLTGLILKDVAARENPQHTRVFGGDVYCFDVVKNPQRCRMQLDGGWLSFASSIEWDGDRIAGILHDFYAQMQP